MNSNRKNRMVMLQVIALFLCGWMWTNASANSYNDIIINFEVPLITELEIDNASVDLLINSATAGEEPEPDLEFITYDITTNGTNIKITGELDENAPTGFVLSAYLWSPGSGNSFIRNLSTTPRDLVTGIIQVVRNDVMGYISLTTFVTSGTITGQRTCILTVVSS